MTKQEFYRQKYQEKNPGWRDSLTLYRDLIGKFVNQQTKILDVGCGHGDFLKPVYDRAPSTYGLDPDKAALDKNTFIKNKFVGSVEKMPFENDFFDLVVCAWVFEHLPEPLTAVKEIFRVLKPGGKLIFLTPNVWNYNVWIIRLVPERFHDFFTKKLYHRQEHDTYPKKYKINSVKKILTTLSFIGFKKTEIILNGDPSYISFNPLLFKFACFLEKILNLKCFHNAKVHIIGIFEK